MRQKKCSSEMNPRSTKTTRKAAGFRVQIYGKFRTYTTIKNNIRGVQL